MRPPPRGVTTTTPPLGIELQIQKVARVFFQDCVILPGAFAYMATPYCDFTHFQNSFSAEGACQKFKKWRARARARLFSRLRNFAGGLAKVSLSEAIRFR